MWCRARMLSCVKFFVTLWTIACQVPLSMEFFRQEYWSELLFPSPGDLHNPGTETASFVCLALAGKLFTTRTTWEAQHVWVSTWVSTYTYIPKYSLSSILMFSQSQFLVTILTYLLNFILVAISHIDSSHFSYMSHNLSKQNYILIYIMWWFA